MDHEGGFSVCNNKDSDQRREVSLKSAKITKINHHQPPIKQMKLGLGFEEQWQEAKEKTRV